MDNCDVVRDLLPLYVDGVCAGGSRALVEEHIKTCPSCSKMLERLRDSACEDSLRRETRTVMAPRRWRNRVFAMGCTLTGFACVPACLAAVLLAKTEKDVWEWLCLLAPALLVMMSTTLLPLRSRYYTGRWTILGCPSSMLTMLLACWVYSGRWAFGAAGAALYLLSAAVLVPWAVKALPLGGVFGGKPRLAVGAWCVYFAAMLAVSWCLAGGRPAAVTVLGIVGACLLAAIALIVLGRLPVNGLLRAGLCVLLAGNAVGWLALPVLGLTGGNAAGSWRAWLLAAVWAAGGALTAAGLWSAYQDGKRRKRTLEKSI